MASSAEAIDSRKTPLVRAGVCQTCLNSGDEGSIGIAGASGRRTDN